MTIIVGITTPDGVILASDSRTTRGDESGHRIISDSAQKVFEIGRFGVATTGLAFIAGNTIAGLMDQFLAQFGEDDAKDVDTFANVLGEFFDARFGAWIAEAGTREAEGDDQGDEPEGRGEGEGNKAEEEEDGWDTGTLGFALTFLVAGYDAEGIGHIHEVKLPGPERGSHSPNTANHGTIWRGQTDVITRMLKGVDMAGLRLPDDGLSEEVLKEIVDGFDLLEYVHLFPVTVQDAVDYSSFLIRTTIDMQRFSDGTLAQPGLIPGCGGPLQILVVERSGTRWATKPELRVT
jgi:hypothetical protein